MLDVRTRRWCGWSIALNESGPAVADALGHAVETSGVPAIWYADRGPGQTSQALEEMLARLGVSVERSIAYNSQARGIIEAFNRRLVAAAKRLPSFMGQDMDADARRRVFQRSRGELALTGTSRLLLPWDEFHAFVEAERERYNATPHSSLPPIPGSIPWRHMSPDEFWNAEKAAGRFEPVMLERHELDDLSRPYEKRLCRRGEIALHGKRYFDRMLEHHDSAELLAGFDIHDPSRVWVRDERLLAVALLDGNRRPYFPQSRLEQARERRRRGAFAARRRRSSAIWPSSRRRRPRSIRWCTRPRIWRPSRAAGGEPGQTLPRNTYSTRSAPLALRA